MQPKESPQNRFSPVTRGSRQVAFNILVLLIKSHLTLKSQVFFAQSIISIDDLVKNNAFWRPVMTTL
jgi:hypothetical protein